MTDWRGDLMDALIDMRQEARNDEWGWEMIELNERIDRAVEAARAEAWDEGFSFSYRGEWNLPQDNPYTTKEN